MMLRNKETGKIEGGVRIAISMPTEFPGSMIGRDYSSLAELNEEWEDYKEPKEYYWIRSGIGDICQSTDSDYDADRFRESIGNYFFTKEEAEQAIEKLKAWQRLKDAGFKLDGWVREGDVIYIGLIDSGEDIDYDELDLLFGGKEQGGINDGR